MGLADSFDLFGLKLVVGTPASPVTVPWVPADDSFDITGTRTADFEAFQTALALGSGPNTKRLSVVAGRFSGGALALELDNAVLGPVTLQKLLVSYKPDGDGFDLHIPKFVPFIGGAKIGGLGFFFDHDFSPPSTTLAAWIELHIIWDVEVGFEVGYDAAHPNGHFLLIGAGTISKFKRKSLPPQNTTYTYTADLASLVPDNAIFATLQADWSKPAAGVTVVGRPTFRVERTLSGQTETYTEDQFAAHGIRLITDPHVATAAKGDPDRRLRAQRLYSGPGRLQAAGGRRRRGRQPVLQLP